MDNENNMSELNQDQMKLEPLSEVVATCQQRTWLTGLTEYAVKLV